ncbi:putative phosphomutase (TIGR03848 family) [Kineococcus xinjiangensis]|uniref:Putative phosphomutase (TIGR03848 family) n=1 Tax=Kineococcus xinjiangensis TaxID=512762 RepID=A0A2S6IKE9_9ACTN|nr:histidine phosphatase family protein [Kineococcus xinjiangensis]PPK94651.1 putative phosphomutase (TIGR03848 family) [Kineococcus xinjiangensis]
MPTLLLVRHGRSTANTAGVLAGWTPGVHLDDHGRAQAAALGQRLGPLPLAALVTSPLERCVETTAALTAVAGPSGPRPQPLVDERLGEARYGDWTGRELRGLVKEPLWRAVQDHPSAVTFPGPEGESLRAMQQRAVDAVREHDARVAQAAGEDAVWVAVTHGDVIKAVLADALGVHLDLFQRIGVDPCSLSAVRYTATRPFVLRMNDTGGDVAALLPPKRRRRRVPATDAVVGGGTGA